MLSGGGALFAWQFEVASHLIAAGFKPAMFGTTSTGTIGAFMLSKGLIKEANDLCDEVYSTDARPISKPGIGRIKNGKITINWLKAVKDVIFRKNKIVSLMDWVFRRSWFRILRYD
ncbi:patatin-like phospholipase family protein [Dyadobacter psychrotolerans]|uniref:Patatin-like phospholipase family protein n=1 Tax=Dyadobacter psychrotolerans TaxID=2541721 RepID=A0A4R5DFT4_9BACT|nr:patatin-like phospholipase family protein [Dyadobacter psychrotolerans]TDE10820.1 patatin-like phospholipase family protein [Dyadobacter psychrotolerans]